MIFTLSSTSTTIATVRLRGPHLTLQVFSPCKSAKNLVIELLRLQVVFIPVIPLFLIDK